MSGRTGASPNAELSTRHQSKFLWVPVMAIILLSFGTVWHIPFGDRSYTLSLVEPFIIISILYYIFSTSGIELYKTDKILILYVIIALVGIFSVSRAENILQSMVLTLALFYGLILYVITLNSIHDAEDNIRYIMIGFRIFIIIQFINLLFNMSPILFGLETAGFYEIKNDYATTALGSSNYLAIFFGISVAYEFISRKRYWIIIGMMSAFGLALTLSRGGVIATILALGAGIFLMNKPKTQSKVLRNNFIVFLLVPLILIASIYYVIGGRAVGAFITFEQAITIESRLELWFNALDEFSTNPIIGTGLEHGNRPHNGFLLVLRSYGLIGIIPFFMFFIYTIKHSILGLRSDCPYSAGIGCALLALWAHTMVEIGILGIPVQILMGSFLAVLVINNSQE